MPSALHCHDRWEAIESRLPDWLAFADRCRLAAPFCGPRVWSAWLKARRSPSEPAVFEWRSGDGELLALLPMERKGTRLEMAGTLHFDYQDLAALDTAAAGDLIAALVEAEGDRASEIVFPQVAEGSRLAQALAAPRLAGLARLERRFWSRCPVASIPREPGRGFETALPSRQRKDYRNASRRIAEALPEHVAEHHGPGSFDPGLVGEAAALHLASQQRKAGPSVLADASLRGTLEALADGESPLCLSLLRPRPGAAPIAFHLGWFDGATYYDYLTAYDAAYAALSPGRWLLVSALAHWHGRAAGDELRLDLLCGEEPYKNRWTAEAYRVARAVLLPHRLSNLPRIVAYAAVYGLKNARNRRLPERGPCLEPDDASGSVALPR